LPAGRDYSRSLARGLACSRKVLARTMRWLDTGQRSEPAPSSFRVHTTVYCIVSCRVVSCCGATSCMIAFTQERVLERQGRPTVNTVTFTSFFARALNCPALVVHHITPSQTITKLSGRVEYQHKLTPPPPRHTNKLYRSCCQPPNTKLLQRRTTTRAS